MSCSCAAGIVSTGSAIKQIKSKLDIEKAFDIRRQVFCIEQNVSKEIEMDEFDEVASHILAFIDDIPVGTARWRFT